MLLVDNRYPSAQLTPCIISNDAFNICVTSFGHRLDKVLVMSVYRAPWATRDDTKEMCDYTDRLAVCFHKIIITGDFNFPNMYWAAKGAVHDDLTEVIFRHLLAEHGLTQLEIQPTWQSA